MSFQLHDPHPPEAASQPVATPFIYVTEPLTWEYKQVMRDLEREGVANEDVLNRLGGEGWELAAAFIYAGRAYYLFKRVAS